MLKKLRPSWYLFALWKKWHQLDPRYTFPATKEDPRYPWKKSSLMTVIVGNLFRLLTIGWQTRGPQHQYTIRRKLFFQWGTCLRPAWSWWVPTVNLLAYIPLWIPLVCWACWQRHTAAPQRAHTDENEPEPGKTPSFFRTNRTSPVAEALSPKSCTARVQFQLVQLKNI